MTLRAGYKSFGFDCVIGGSFGGWSEIDARALLEPQISNLNKNGPSYWGNIYDPVINPTGNMPNPYWDDINTTPVSNFWKVSSLRLRVINANVNYSLPKRITEYLKISNVPAARFGRDAMGDPRFVFDLRKGREPRPRTVSRILAYLESAL